jgi:hypothetical protein
VRPVAEPPDEPIDRRDPPEWAVREVPLDADPIPAAAWPSDGRELLPRFPREPRDPFEPVLASGEPPESPELVLPPWAVEGPSAGVVLVPTSVFGNPSSQGIRMAVTRPEIAVNNAARTAMWRVRIGAHGRRRRVAAGLSVDAGSASLPSGNGCQVPPDVSAYLEEPRVVEDCTR